MQNTLPNILNTKYFLDQNTYLKYKYFKYYLIHYTNTDNEY